MAANALFREENLIDDASMKLGVARSILSALHEQHNNLREAPTLEQSEISTLIYAAMRLVEAANESVQAMPLEAGKQESAAMAEAA